jgi:branched-chain amino acid transport system substrate-binding protein
MSNSSLKRILTVVLSFWISPVCYSSPDGQTKVIKVGLVFDLTGKREPALDVVKGIELAASHLQKVNGFKIELIKYNSESNAAGTKTAIQNLLKDPPDVVIAEVDSSKAVVAAEMLESAKRVMITPYATSPVVTDGRKYIFRACFADDFQGKKLAVFASQNIKAKRVAIFSDGGELYSQTLAKSFREQFERDGGKIVYDEKIISSASTFKDQIDAAILNNVDAVFLPVYEQTAARFINEAIARTKKKLVFLGGDGWGASRTFRDIVFRKASPVDAYWVSHYSGDFGDKTINDIAESFLKLTGEEFNASAAIGYDSMMVVGQALMRINNHKISQESLINELRTMPAYRGASGTISYAGGQDPQKSLFIRKIDGNKMGFVTEITP